MPPTTSALYGEKAISSAKPANFSLRFDLKHVLMAAFGGPTLVGVGCVYFVGWEHPFPVLTLYGLSLLVSYLSVSRWLLRQFHTAAQSTSRIAGGEHQHRLSKPGNLEFDQLADSINDLASQLTDRLHQTELEGNQTRSLLDSLPEPVLAYNVNNELTYLNPAARHTLRLENQETIGRQLAASWQGLVAALGGKKSAAAETHEDPSQKLLRLAVQLPDGAGEVRLGARRVYWVTVIPYREGDRQGRVLVLRDLTDLRRLEEVRTLFLGAVSHELRTPLTIIKGFAVTLSDHPSVVEDPSLSKHLLRIDQEADRLTRLVNDLLDLTRLQSQRLSIEMQSVEPESLIEETLGLLQPLAERQNVRLQQSHTVSGGNSMLRADRDRLKQVLINLVDNAIKFSPGDSFVRVRSVLSETEWVLTVEDNGPGVSPEELLHLFEHFFRGRQTRKVTGSGLGLAIVKEIVELHCGTITADCDSATASRLDKTRSGEEIATGLRVTVRIPVTQPS
jgi:two-component system phosphate regulon sensor histidine kinase PhoR